MSMVPGITLNEGNTIPQLDFGVFQLEPKDTAKAVRKALEIGYRHIDTAEMYGNEKQVGEVIRSSGLDRSEVFVTSKPQDACEAFDGTLSELGFDTLTCSSSTGPQPANNGVLCGCVRDAT